MNETIWLLQIILGTSCILWAAKYHMDTLIDSLPLLPIAMNLYVTKMILLGGHILPSGDSLAVMFGLGLNVVAYQKGNDLAMKILNRSLIAMVIWFTLTLAHVALTPLDGHPISEAHQLVFTQTPWICIASWISFYTSQGLERYVFSRMITRSPFFYANAVSTLISQSLDTILFTIIGLYFQPIDFMTVILWSLLIKGIAWLISNAGVHLIYESNLARRIPLRSSQTIQTQ